MALLKLPCEVQSILCASTHINSYNSAVEELVYNALDAGTTAIAIRIDIEDNAIQVVDNGQGILKSDFKLLGRKYMTSKCVDIATLKCMPKQYGFRGESLSNIIRVSQTVKISSRHANSEETWSKTFTNGKEGRIVAIKSRPSKGTTVEIQEFLHNLHIQKKAINALYEIQAIKTFLEHLSLVHNNLSISLRDDSTNEIVFKLHKQRDVYQTLSSLFGIEGPDIQELKVEKGPRKITGLIGKTDTKIGKHWIYLNGKFVYNCKLHKVINEYFSKFLCKENNIKTKLKYARDDSEYALLKSKIPFYFIFITCPYIDYDISYTAKQNILEFKNWEHIKKILEKLVQFYTGDINLREIKKPKTFLKKEADTRNDVKEIIERVLKSNFKKLREYQMQKGIKGKSFKRINKKKSSHTPKISLSRIIPPRHIIKSDNAVNNILDTNLRTLHYINGDFKEIKKSNKKNAISSNISNVVNKPFDTNELFEEQTEPIRNQFTRPQESRQITKIKKRKTKQSYKTNMRKFENPTTSLKRRYKMITKQAEHILNNDKQKLRKFFSDVISEHDHYDCTSNNQKLSVYKNVQYVNNYDTPLLPKFNRHNIGNHAWDSGKDKQFKTTYDLIHTILQSQRGLASKNKNHHYSEVLYKEPHQFKNKTMKSSIQSESKLTFASHNYNDTNETDISQMNHFKKDIRFAHFITRQSRDNFEELINKRYSEADGSGGCHNNKIHANSKRQYKHSTKFCNNFEETSYTIEFTQNNQIINSKDYFVNQTSHFSISDNSCKKKPCHECDNDNVDVSCKIIEFNNQNTYTLSSTQKSMAVFTDLSCPNRDKPYLNLDQTYSIHHTKSEYDSVKKVTPTRNDDRDVIVSKSQSPNENVIDIIHVEPLNICETILTNDTDNRYQNDDALKVFLNEKENLSDLNKSESPQDVKDYINEIHSSDKVSHHFAPSIFDGDVPNVTPNVLNQNDNELNRLNHNNVNELAPVLNNKELCVDERTVDDNSINKQLELDGEIIEMADIVCDAKHFNLKYRPRFLPKGMSQIFVNCNSKSVCNYDLDKKYFKGNMYDEFVRQVQMNSELFEPRIENVNRYTTKDIEKVSHKLNKDNASLIFKGESLRGAKVLGQVDEKFIATVMREKCNENKEIADYLILFDQHAVHERIRLEKNLSDYMDGNQWKSARVDEITLKLSSDDVLYLHNFKDKFSQLGLQWIILNNQEVSITAIPEAILGKNPRQVDKIMVAVKNLIAEEINMIKLLKGCVSLYPKSITDLVFSEACRYAIKFGDKLSLKDCTELLRELSGCKTPFQCAHGRPVMAVLMDYKNENRKYEINIKGLHNFKNNMVKV